MYASWVLTTPSSDSISSSAMSLKQADFSFSEESWIFYEKNTSFNLLYMYRFSGTNSLRMWQSKSEPLTKLSKPHIPQIALLLPHNPKSTCHRQNSYDTPASAIVHSVFMIKTYRIIFKAFLTQLWKKQISIWKSYKIDIKLERANLIHAPSPPAYGHHWTQRITWKPILNSHWQW